MVITRVDPGGLGGGGAAVALPYFHEEKQRTTNESAAKMKSRVIYRVCAHTYVGISVVWFNIKECVKKIRVRLRARFFPAQLPPF